MLLHYLKIYNFLIDTIYPPLCFYCGEKINTKHSLLCQECGSLLEIFEPKEQCPRCFASSHSKKDPCPLNSTSIYRAAAALEYSGPATMLIKQLKYQGQSYISKGLGAFVVAQFVALRWPTPDFIIPIPQTFLKGVVRGYNHSKLIADEVGKLINVPVKEPLKRKIGSVPQAGLTKEQRRKLKSKDFKVKRKSSYLVDKTILFIDDVMTTRATLIACAEALQVISPKRIYALTVCC